MQTFRLVLTTVLVVCAVIVTALVVRRELLLGRMNDRQPDQVIADSLWQKISEYDIALGSRSARVKMVEFYDYECPYCLRFHPVLDSILAKYPNDVTLIYRHYPVEYHTGAYQAAIAAECAEEQGVFKAFHDVLFVNQPQLSGTVNWDSLAQSAGMPYKDHFLACVSEAKSSPKVNADTALAGELGVDAIPTLIVNRAMYSGAMSITELDEIVRKALKEAD